MIYTSHWSSWCRCNILYTC